MSSSSSAPFSSPPASSSLSSSSSPSSSSGAASLDALLSSVSYADKGRLLTDLSSLLSQTNSLSPHLSPFHSPTVPLSSSSSSSPSAGAAVLALTGTLPIYYRSNCYHIPVSLFIPEEYPFRPPVAYVTPTRDMRIKERHPHVDSAGVVYLPYLHQWGPDSGLVELVSVMASVFSEDPPVFKVAANAAAGVSLQHPAHPSPAAAASSLQPIAALHLAHLSAAAAAAHSQQMQAVGGASPLSSAAASPFHSSFSSSSSSISPSSSAAPFAAPTSSSSTSSALAQPSLLPPLLPPSSSTSSVSSSLSSPSLTPSPEPLSPLTVARHRLLSALTRRAQELLRSHHSDASQDMDRSLAQQEQIRARRAALGAELQTMEAETRQLEEAREAMRGKRREVEQWLSANEAGAGAKTVDELVWCRDTWSRQLMEAVSLDVALDDSMTALDRALSEGVVDVEKFVKLMRGLSRQQYFHKAIALQLQHRQTEAKQLHQTHPQQSMPNGPAAAARFKHSPSTQTRALAVEGRR